MALAYGLLDPSSRDRLIGPADATLSTAASVPWVMGANALGLLAAGTGMNPVEAAAAAHRHASNWSVAPRTAQGQRALEALGAGASAVGSSLDSAGQSALGVKPSSLISNLQRSYPNASALLGMAAQAAPLAGGLVGGVSKIADMAELRAPPLGATITGGSQRGAVGLLKSNAQPAPKRGKPVLISDNSLLSPNPEMNAPHPNPSMPQLADRYPETLPFVIKIDKKKGPYEARNNSQEGKQLLKERAKINADMDANPDFPRMFNPSERFYADPSYHPTNEQPTIGIVPKTEKTTIQHDARINTRENVDLLKSLAASVENDPRAHHWYAMGQAQREAQRVLGDAQAGADAFDRNFSTPMGATTALADPETNLMSTGFSSFQRRSGLPVAMESHEAPVPTSGIALKGNLKNAEKFDLLSSLRSADNSKRFNFVSNFNGHLGGSTMDKVMTKILDKRPGISAPPDGQYGIYERPVHRAAAEAGLTPAEMQARPWIATQIATDPNYVPRPAIEELNRAIERTHRITGTPRQEIFNRYMAGIGKPHTLLSVGGTVAGAGLLSSRGHGRGGT
jgi:hypothetical protein